MTTTVTFDELPGLVGQELGQSDWVTVDQETIDVFGRVTGDEQWIHTDVERARQGPFGTTIAHGYLTLALIPQLARQALTVEGVGMGVNYGLNTVRFPSPVPSGSRVRGEFTLLAADPIDGGGYQVVFQAVIRVEGAERPSCVAETVARYYP